MGSGCGAVGKAFPSYSRDPRFESSHRLISFTITINCIEETKLKKETGNGPTFLRKSFCAVISVTRLGDLLNFGQLFKAFGNN